MNVLDTIFNIIYFESGLNQLSLRGISYFLSIIILAFIIELTSTGWKDSSIRIIIKMDKSARMDILMSFLEAFNLFNAIALILSFGLSFYFSTIIQKHVNLKLISIISNPGLQFSIVFIISDFKEYVKHYIFHKFPPFWSLHQFHHSATNLNILTTYRFHFYKNSFSIFFDVMPLIILGAPIQTYFGIKFLRKIQGLLQHSNANHNWGYWKIHFSFA